MQIPLHKIDENKIFIKWRDINIEPSSEEHAHRHNYFQFMFLEKVSGTHNIDFETHDATNESVHFVGKGRVHTVDFSTDVKGGVLLFPEAIFSHSKSDMKLLSSLSYFKNGAHPVLELTTSNFDSVNALLQKLKTFLDTNAFDLCKHLLFALLIQVRDIYNQSGCNIISKEEPQELVQYNQLLKEHCRTWNSVEDYTATIGITASRLTNFCKEAYGKTALQILHSRKLLEAKRMLVYTEKQVKEIAYDCGFDDVAYFNRFFKKHTNCAPLTFRKNH